MNTDQKDFKHRELTYKIIVVEDAVIVELKAVKAIDGAHEAQLLNYLKATEVEVGLLMNFGSKPEFKRFVSR
jgi:GxxExxY protein